MVNSRGRNKNTIRLTGADLVFDVLNTIFMILFLLIMLYPLWFALIASFSNYNALSLGEVTLWPVGFNLVAYENVFINEEIWVGYLNSIIYTVGSTVFSLAIMLPLAYALSKKNLFGRGLFTWFFLFTMYFGGGMVPSFILMNNLGLTNTPWVMILGSVSAYNMVITRTFFMNSIPNEVYESAKIDGANEFRCFFQIALPLSSAIIAVMALYFAVGSWNSYFQALVYITKSALFPLQLVLRNILIEGQMLMMKLFCMVVKLGR